MGNCCSSKRKAASSSAQPATATEPATAAEPNVILTPPPQETDAQRDVALRENFDQQAFNELFNQRRRAGGDEFLYTEWVPARAERVIGIPDRI